MSELSQQLIVIRKMVNQHKQTEGEFDDEFEAGKIMGESLVLFLDEMLLLPQEAKEEAEGLLMGRKGKHMQKLSDIIQEFDDRKIA